MTAEDWLPIPDANGYEASTLGRIRKATPHGLRVVGYLDKSTGYIHVLMPSGKRALAHRLICATFHGLPEDGQEVAHGNGVRDDNRPENLRWATRKENHADKREHGTWQGGEAHAMSVLRESDAFAIIGSDESAKDLAAKYEVSPHAIYDIRRGKTWKHLPRK